MGRGMNLSEFKAALSSDATIENENLKKELEELKNSSSERIKELEEELKYTKKIAKQLSNRCYVFTKGAMCLSCKIDECRYAYTSEELEAASRHMQKNNIPRTDVGWLKMNDFLMDLRAKRLNKK